MTKRKSVPGVLPFIGSGKRYIPGVPMHDLSSHDLERLVYRRVRLRPGDEGYAEALAKRKASLVASGLYVESVRDAPRTATEPVTTPDSDLGAIRRRSA